MSNLISDNFFLLNVFISYSNKDREFVTKLVSSLKEERIGVWIDQYEIGAGELISRSIEEGIEKNDVFLIVISGNSVKSGWVTEELTMIIDRVINNNSLVIPIIIDDIQVPSILKTRRWVDFRNDFFDGFSVLLQSLRKKQKVKSDYLLQQKEVEIEVRFGGSQKKLSEALSALGNLALSIKNIDQGIHLIKKSIVYSETNVDAKNLLATAYIKLGKFNQAEKILKDLILQKSQKARANYNLACLYSKKAENYYSQGKTQRTIKKYLNLSHDHFKKSLSMRFISWLRAYASRSDPVGDIFSDPDLIFSRKNDPRVEEIFNKLMSEYEVDWVKSQVYNDSSGCVVGSTLISLGDGNFLPIKEIKCGEKVWNTYRASNSIVWRKMRLWENEGVKINGELVISLSQRILTLEGWKSGKELKHGDSLVLPDGNCKIIDSISEWNVPQEIFHINLDGIPIFVGNGYILHNAKI